MTSADFQYSRSQPRLGLVTAVSDGWLETPSPARRSAMSRVQTIVLGLAALAGAGSASGCGDGATEPPPPDAPRPTTVTVTVA